MTAPYTHNWESYSELNAELKKLLENPVYEDFKMVTNETTPESLRAMSKGRPKSQLWPNVIEKDIQIPMCDGTLSHARVYSPESAGVERRPLLVMAFGGGYVVGNLESEENNCRSWAKNHGGVAVSISYRLAPENPWPIPHKDIYDGVKWIAANYKDLGADPSMAFLIGGVSSGATTMCTISHLWRDEGLKPPLTGLYLSVPNLCIISALPEKYREKENSWEQNKDAPIFNREVSNFLATHVNPDPYDPLRSPMLHPTGHKNLPPTYFVIAGADPWRDCGLIYEEILRVENGIKTKLDIFPGLPHGFWGMFPVADFSKRYAEKSKEGFKWLLEQSLS